jgi:superfamily II DNA or RNA helicase
MGLCLIGLTIKTETQFDELTKKDSIILAKNKQLLEQLETLQVYSDSIEYLELDNNWLRYMMRSKNIITYDSLQQKRIGK